MLIRKVQAAALVAVFGVAALGSVAEALPANAQQRYDTAQSNTQQQAQQAQQTVQQAEQHQETGQAQVQERREAAQGRLNEATMKACEKREKAIKNIMTHLPRRGERQLDVFTKISDRTQAFYEKKGRTLSNYDALVKEVDAKKAAAETAVGAVRNSSTTFECDGENPKGVVNSFKQSLRAQNAALKDYKTAVKNLIVGVKSVQSTEAAETTTEDAKTEGNQQ